VINRLIEEKRNEQHETLGLHLRNY